MVTVVVTVFNKPGSVSMHRPPPSHRGYDQRAEVLVVRGLERIKNLVTPRQAQTLLQRLHLEHALIVVPPRCRGASSDTRFKLKALYALSGSRVERLSLSSKVQACTALPRDFARRLALQRHALPFQVVELTLAHRALYVRLRHRRDAGRRRRSFPRRRGRRLRVNLTFEKPTP